MLPIGLQLYSVRNEMEKDFEGTLAKVAEMGYEGVELAGLFGKSAAEIRAMLEKNGLATSIDLPAPEMEIRRLRENLNVTDPADNTFRVMDLLPDCHAEECLRVQECAVANRQHVTRLIGQLREARDERVVFQHVVHAHASGHEQHFGCIDAVKRLSLDGYALVAFHDAALQGIERDLEFP